MRVYEAAGRSEVGGCSILSRIPFVAYRMDRTLILLRRRAVQYFIPG